MHLLRNKATIQGGNWTGPIAPGEWLVTDRNAFELGVIGGPLNCQLTHAGCAASRDVGDNSLLIVRTGAWGDLLLLMPALRALRATGKYRKIALACFPIHEALFRGTGLVDEIVPYPVPIEAGTRFQHVISLEEAIESQPESHATDAFAAGLGGVEIADWKPDYVVTDEEYSEANGKYPRSDKPRVALHIASSAANRNYPVQQWKMVIERLIKKGWEVMILGAPRQLKDIKAGPNFLPVHNATFRHSAAAMKTCDAFCGVDSVWSHMCHALDIPGVGIYGAFSPSTRTGRNPNFTALVGQGACAPCSFHAHAGRAFPADEACANVGRCTVLAGIAPDKITQAVDKLKPVKITL